MNKRFIIGLTGPMCAGKNRCAQLLSERGFAAVDADSLVHSAIEVAKPLILKAFSTEATEKHIELCNEDGTINRRALGKLVFSDKKLLLRQETLIHPIVDSLMKSFIADHPDTHIVLNATVLYKTPVITQCDFIIYIDASFIIRFYRSKKRDKLPTQQILQRFCAQAKLFTQHKKKNADIVKVSNGFRAGSLPKRLENLLKRKGVAYDVK